MKHMEKALATYVYSHSSICNIPIYFCNIHMKHLQHTSETFETYTCNMRFQQNLTTEREEHCTTGSDCAVVVEKEDDSGVCIGAEACVGACIRVGR